MKQLVIADNPFNPSSWIYLDTDDVCASMKEHFGDSLPESARIYWNDVAQSCDVTPRVKGDIERLQSLEGRIIVMVYPAGVGAIIAAIIVIIIAVVATIALAPKAPTTNTTNNNLGSSNNQLSGRSNTQRPGQRIPDIYGAVWSTPDLLALPYSVYTNNQQVEIAYMCIGRGTFSIDPTEVFDGDTLISSIAGASVEIWGPGKSPNTTGAVPQLTIGARISGGGFAIQTAARSNSVNGQVLRAPNQNTLTGSTNISFVYPDTIVTNDSAVDFTKDFDTDDALTVSSANPVNGLDLNGTYSVLAVSNSQITLANPPAINAAWNGIASLTGGQTDYVSPVLATSGSKWIGPFVVDSVALSQIVCNFVATNGLYRENSSGDYHALNVGVEIWVTPTDPTTQAARTITDLNTGTDFTDWQPCTPILIGVPITTWSIVSSKWQFSSQLVFNPIYYAPPSGSGNFILSGATTLTLKGKFNFSADTPNLRVYPGGSPNFDTTVPANINSFSGAYVEFDFQHGQMNFWESDGSGGGGTPGSISFADGVDYYFVIQLINNNIPFGANPADYGHSGTIQCIANVYLDSDHTTSLGTAGSDFTPLDEYLAIVPTSHNTSTLATGAFWDVEVDTYYAPGTPESFSTTINGSAITRTYRAGTLYATPTFSGGASVMARRSTQTYNGSGNTVVDSIQWQDFYTMAPVTATDFGDVTTVLARTFATAGALSVKQRRLNMLASRMLPTYNGDGTFDDSTLVATNSAADAFCQMVLDPSIGGLTSSDVDIEEVYTTVDDINTYFRTARASQFCYTFDDFNTSLEESLQTIANAVFCEAYRQGSVIGLSFEKATDTSTILFNHRNKLPGTETRTVNFGNTNDYDGVAFQWTNPVDDSAVFIYLPDESAVNPQKITSTGIRNYQQAAWLANRIYAKILRQHTAVQFDCTHEAALLNINDRIIVSDGTRADIIEGEILDVNGLILTVSQPYDPAFFSVGCSIFLQHYDNSVESIVCSVGADNTHIVLSTAPLLPLVTDSANYAKTTYSCVKNALGDDPDNFYTGKAFLVASKKSTSTYTYTLTAINYDFRYYAYDASDPVTPPGQGPA